VSDVGQQASWDNSTQVLRQPELVWSRFMAPPASNPTTSAASSPEATFIPWNRNDASGQPIDRSVYSWVETADALVADISETNHNVTYEVGLALGTRKSLRLIRAANKDRKLLEEIGLLHNIGHDDFNAQQQLIDILRRPRGPYALAKPMLLPIPCPGIGPQPRQPWRFSAATSFLTRADIVHKGVGCTMIAEGSRQDWPYFATRPNT
jgi:hypothetical protein